MPSENLIEQTPLKIDLSQEAALLEEVEQPKVMKLCEIVTRLHLQKSPRT